MSQTLGGYTIYDFLVSSSSGCVTGFELFGPDSNTVINYNANTIVTAYFGSSHTDNAGDDVLLETSFHPDNYDVRLILSDGSFSSLHHVSITDWIHNSTSFKWKVGSGCGSTPSYTDDEYILPLDFGADFGLSNTDVVDGVEIKMLSTGGAPDLAGVYIISDAPVSLNVLNFRSSTSNNDLFLKWGTSMLEKEYSLIILEGGHSPHSFNEISIFENTNNRYDFEYRIKNENKMNYYRLKLVSTNGSFTYSNVLKIDRNELITYYNKDSQEITLYNFDGVNVFFSIHLIDPTGRTISSNELYIQKQAKNSIKLNHLNVLPGIYYLIVESEGNVEIQKIAIE